MSIFSFTKKENELFLVFHIGSASVGGALFRRGESGTPQFIFSTKEHIELEKEVHIDRFLVKMLQALGVIAKRVHDAKLGAPKKVFCVLSSPWYVSEERMIRYSQENGFLFTEKLADSLIQNEIKVFEEEHKTKYQGKVRAIELKHIKTKLNGYDIERPLNQKTKEVEMGIFVSIAGEEVLASVEGVIGKYFHFNQIKFSSFLISSYTALRDMALHEENFLLIDVGGEVTDVTMIKKNILRQSISFPLGHHFFTRGVALALNCTLDEANSYISLFRDEHALESTREQLKKVMMNLRLEWVKKFQESLANISNDISIPNTIYMAIDVDLADFFAETIKTEQFSQYTLAESKFEIVFLGPTLLHGFATFNENAIRDSFLILDSIYINRFLTKI